MKKITTNDMLKFIIACLILILAGLLIMTTPLREETIKTAQVIFKIELTMSALMLLLLAFEKK